MELAEATGFVEACIHDRSAPCSRACPFGLDIRSFLKKAARGRWPAAYRELRTATLFPSVAAALCPRPCMEHCQRSLLGDDSLDLAALEAAVLRLAGEQPPDTFPVPPKDSSIAVVGAGPAGLSLALRMARKKYPVTVFEALEGWGGALRQHPDFPVFDRDFKAQFSAEKVDFRFGVTVKALEELSDHASVYIATGREGSHFGLLEVWDRDSLRCGDSPFFLGGALSGMPLMEGIAAGAIVSRGMESVLQTGKVLPEPERAGCGDCRLIPPDAQPAPRVIPADPAAGYTREEAKGEAARCFQCNCSACMDGCELLKTYRKPPSQMAMEVLADSSPHFLASRTMTRETYSCNQCGYCKSICPTGVDMGELFRFSREARAAEGIQPAALHEFWLQELDFTAGQGFYASKGPCDALFFPGCQLAEMHPSQVLDIWHFLREKGSFGILLGCCGAPALWAGDGPRQLANLDKLLKAWEAMGRPWLVTACASCAKMLRRQAPEMEIESLYEVLVALDAPSAPLPFREAALFDPCAAREDEKAHEAVMALGAGCGCALEALPDGGKCCGYGGHIRLANPELYSRITENRMGESEKPYVVYCANCLEVFRAKGKPCAHILDGVFGDRDEPGPTLSRKRQNLLLVKEALMKELDNTPFVPDRKPWDALELQISPELRRDMEEMLILDEDMRELIFLAEREQAYFLDETGLRCASMVRPVIVYWGEYRPLGGNRYELLSAYCHRMHFGEES